MTVGKTEKKISPDEIFKGQAHKLSFHLQPKNKMISLVGNDSLSRNVAQKPNSLSTITNLHKWTIRNNGQWWASKICIVHCRQLLWLICFLKKLKTKRLSRLRYFLQTEFNVTSVARLLWSSLTPLPMPIAIAMLPLIETNGFSMVVLSWKYKYKVGEGTWQT